MLEVIIIIIWVIVGAGGGAILVNKSTEAGSFDWIKSHLRFSWMVYLCLLSVLILSHPVIWGFAMKTHKEWNTKIGYCLLFVLGGLILCGYFWFADRTAKLAEKKNIVHPEQSTIDKDIPTPQSMNIPLYKLGVRSAIISDNPGNLTLFMVCYKSMLGDTASPVFYLVNISITNQQNIVSTIEGYSATVSDTEKGPWQELMPISLMSSNLYILGVRNDGTGSIGFPRGVYRLATAMTRKDMANAALLNVSPKLEVELTRPIGPSQTVGGWAAFDLKDHNIRRVRNYICITVCNSVGKSFSEVIAISRQRLGDSEIDTQVGIISKVGPLIDISSFHVRYYSDLYPSRN